MAAFKHNYEIARDTVGHTLRTGQGVARLVLLGGVCAVLATIPTAGLVMLSGLGIQLGGLAAAAAGVVSIGFLARSEWSLGKKVGALTIGLGVAALGIYTATMIAPALTFAPLAIGLSSFAIISMAMKKSYENTLESIGFHAKRILPRYRTSHHSPSLTMSPAMRKELDDMATAKRAKQASVVTPSASTPTVAPSKKNINDVVMTVRDGRY